MKKLILKIRIIFTNICRTIYSFLFINLVISNGKVLGVNNVGLSSLEPEPTCYMRGAHYEPSQNNYKILFILVPIALIIIGIGTFIAIKKHKRNKYNKERKS